MDRVPMGKLSVNELPLRRAVICALVDMGQTPKEVEAKALCSDQSRRSALQHYTEFGHHFDLPRPGRPAKHTKRDKRELDRSIDTGEVQTAAEATQIYNSTCSTEDQFSSSSVRAILVKYDLRGRAKPQKPALKAPQRLQRYKWAQDMKHLMDTQVLNWDYVISPTNQNSGW